MKRIRLVLPLTFVLLLAVSVAAQEDEGKWRNFEVAINSGLTLPAGDLKNWNDSLGAKLGFELSINGGYYFTEDFCSGVYFTYSQFAMENDYELHFRSYGAGAYAKYSFSGESNFEPYVKLSGGINWLKFPTWVTSNGAFKLRELSYDPVFEFAGYAGLLYYTSYYSGLFLEFGYHNVMADGTESIRGSDYKIEHAVNYMDIRLGIMAFFGSEE
jgi:hypothetical protein